MMTSHGIPRGNGVRPSSDQDRRRELQKIKDYKGLVDSVAARIRGRQYTPETLDLTSKLLGWNPEYYTVWNYRRLIMQRLLTGPNVEASDDDIQSPGSEVKFISYDLEYFIPLLRKFPKCYWIWNYRLWLLEKSTDVLSAATARQLWQQEFALANKMLGLDSRNFHGWGYRRTVVAALESSALQSNGSPTSLTEDEYQYTTKMISSDLSNFSAWHNRSKLIPKLLNERGADKAARRKFLDEELELIERALWTGDQDQSLWFYHQYLMCTFDPRYASESMAPCLSTEERIKYVAAEIEKITEMLDGAEDCKWIYQSLINLSLLYKISSDQWPVQKEHIHGWIDQLRKLDPLRIGRWNELTRQVRSSQNWATGLPCVHSTER